MEGRRRSSVADDDQLAALGVKQELKRNFSFLSMLGLAFAILNSWTALSASLSLALPSGGSTSVLWGLITAGVCNLALAASLAEFLSAYPTAGGQYHWVQIIAWDSWKPILSWTTGWINVFGWMALTATAGLLGSQLIVGIIALFNPSYQEKTWHLFLIYLAYAIAETLVNSFGNSALPLINKTAISWSITGFVVISITVLAVASPNYNSADFVFRLFVNETGWPDGLAWLLGLLQGGLALTGYDATVHMVEEIPDATIVAPKILLYCVLIGMFTGFIFNMCLLFVAPSLQHTISSPYGPLGQILYTATSSKAGTVCLLIFPLVCLMFAGISIMTTSSRMAYAFARDGGLPFSKLLARVHPRLDVPLESIALTFIVVVVFGLIDLGSSAAFNAIISASVVALGLSYGIPVTINVLRGRKMLPASRPFKMPEWLAWPANLLGIAYVLITTVLFVFPPAIPVSGTSMNYCIVAFAIVLLISMITWFVDGRKNYKGPKIWIDPSMLTAEQSAEIEGVGSNGQFESDDPEEKSKKM